MKFSSHFLIKMYYQNIPEDPIPCALVVLICVGASATWFGEGVGHLGEGVGHLQQNFFGNFSKSISRDSSIGKYRDVGEISSISP